MRCGPGLSCCRARRQGPRAGVAVLRPLVVAPGAGAPRPPLALAAPERTAHPTRAAAARRALVQPGGDYGPAPCRPCRLRLPRRRPAALRRLRLRRTASRRAYGQQPGYGAPGYGYAMAGGEPPHPPYAGFWIRFLGQVLDSILYGLSSSRSLIARRSSLRVASRTATDRRRRHDPSCRRASSRVSHWPRHHPAGRRSDLRPSCCTCIHIGRYGQTWGCRITGLKVVDRDSGIEPIGIGARPRAHAVLHHLRLRVLPRLPLDAVGQAEADVAGQGRQQHRREGLT